MKIDKSSETVADTIAVISRDIEMARYELETVKDREEAVRLVRRVGERVERLANHLGVADRSSG